VTVCEGQDRHGPTRFRAGNFSEDLTPELRDPYSQKITQGLELK